jgi:hypothetical protein
MSYNTFLHKISLIRCLQGSPLGYRCFTIELISGEVQQQVVERLAAFNDDQLLDMWTWFPQFGAAWGMTGQIFEAFVHWCFRRCINVDATPMVQSNHANSCWYASFSPKSPHFTVHGMAQQAFSLHIDISCICLRYHHQTTYSTRCLLHTPKWPTSHSWLLYTIWRMSQCISVHCHNHGIKDGLVSFLASCSGLPPWANWQFVFILPDDLDLFSSPVSSVSIIKDLGLYTAHIPISRVWLLPFILRTRIWTNTYITCLVICNFAICRRPLFVTLLNTTFT